MGLGAEDRARLQGIESGLSHDDPDLVARFRTWRAPSGRAALPPGWSAAPPWVLAVFALAACGWVVSPVLAGLVVVVGVLGRLWRRAARRVDPPRGGPAPGRTFVWPDHRG